MGTVMVGGRGFWGRAAHSVVLKPKVRDDPYQGTGGWKLSVGCQRPKEVRRAFLRGVGAEKGACCRGCGDRRPSQIAGCAYTGDRAPLWRQKTGLHSEEVIELVNMFLVLDKGLTNMEREKIRMNL